MKKVILILSLFFLFTLTCSARSGDIKGQYFDTDIVTTMNGRPINSYNIGGITCISGEDLSYFAFDTEWDAQKRQLILSNKRGKETESEKLPSNYHRITLGKSGTVAGDYFETNIKTMLDGKEISSYNIGGVTVIPCEELMQHGYSVKWDGVKRTLDVIAPASGTYQYSKTIVRLNTFIIPSYEIAGKLYIVCEDLQYFNYYVINDTENKRLFISKMNSPYFIPIENVPDFVDYIEQNKGVAGNYKNSDIDIYLDGLSITGYCFNIGEQNIISIDTLESFGFYSERMTKDSFWLYLPTSNQYAENSLGNFHGTPFTATDTVLMPYPLQVDNQFVDVAINRRLYSKEYNVYMVPLCATLHALGIAYVYDNVDTYDILYDKTLNYKPSETLPESFEEKSVDSPVSIGMNIKLNGAPVTIHWEDWNQKETKKSFRKPFDGVVTYDETLYIPISCLAELLSLQTNWKYQFITENYKDTMKTDFGDLICLHVLDYYGDGMFAESCNLTVNGTLLNLSPNLTVFSTVNFIPLKTTLEALGLSYTRDGDTINIIYDGILDQLKSTDTKEEIEPIPIAEVTTVDLRIRVNGKGQEILTRPIIDGGGHWGMGRYVLEPICYEGVVYIPIDTLAMMLDMDCDWVNQLTTKQTAPAENG